MANVVKNIMGYVERFIPGELPKELLGVAVTHMDKVNWTEKDLSPYLEKRKIPSAIFTNKSLPEKELLEKIVSRCNGKIPVNLCIDENNFHKIFKLPDESIRIMKFVREEVRSFCMMTEDFTSIMKDNPEPSEQIVMKRDFKIFAESEIRTSEKLLKKVLDSHHSFDKTAMSRPSDEAHLANMNNQLHAILLEVGSDDKQEEINSTISHQQLFEFEWSRTFKKLRIKRIE